MATTTRFRLTLLAAVLAAGAFACNEFEDPAPASPTVPEPPATQFQIAGRWDGKTDQGRPLRFDVRATGSLVQGKVSVHHDCTGGRLVLQLADYETRITGNTFSATVIWRRDEPGGKFYSGTLSVSGTFAGDKIASGGFVNSITDKQADNLGVCEPTSGSWEASKSE